MAMVDTIARNVNVWMTILILVYRINLNINNWKSMYMCVCLVYDKNHQKNGRERESSRRSKIHIKWITIESGGGGNSMVCVICTKVRSIWYIPWDKWSNEPKKKRKKKWSQRYHTTSIPIEIMVRSCVWGKAIKRHSNMCLKCIWICMYLVNKWWLNNLKNDYHWKNLKRKTVQKYCCCCMRFAMMMMMVMVVP